MRRNAYRSPHSVSFDDLIKSTEKSIAWMKANYRRMIAEGKISAWSAQHNISVEEAKLRLFERFKRDPQTNLFDEFHKHHQS